MFIESRAEERDEFSISPLNEEWIKRAEQELGETETVRLNALNELRNEISSQFNFKFHLQDDFLLRFLRARKFNVQKAFKLFDKYREMKETAPALFRVSPVYDMKFVLEMEIQMALPINEDFGQQIYIYRVANLNPFKVPVDYVFRSNMLWFETLIRQEQTQIGGISVILDMTGVGLAHARYLTPYLAKKTVEVVQEVFPMRFKAFHVVHEPFYFNAILNILKPFLKDKIRKRIFTHGSNMKSLQKFIPSQYLPKEYGGQAEICLSNTYWRKYILNNAQYYENLESNFTVEIKNTNNNDTLK
uniref:CSON000244 protein n=1 Tax=Culicoides sonorensis TaxID=179676 RepID=A0A336MJM3_CULSO